MKSFRQMFAKFLLWGVIVVAVLSFLIPTCSHDPQPLPEICFEQEEYFFRRLEEISDSVFPILDSIFDRMRELFNQ